MSKKHSRASSLLQIVFFVIAPGIAHADYQTGLNAYVDGDFDKAMAEWKAEVNKPGEPENLAIYRESLYAIGMLYWQGEGVAQDYAVSAAWLKQAADINHPGAQNKLGYLYSTGQGVPQNFQQARHYFEMAAAQGDPDASHNLDEMFRQGLLAADSASEPVMPPVEHAQPVTELLADPGLAKGVAVAVSPATGESSPAPPAKSMPDHAHTVAGDNGVEWIRAQNPEHYTIQVVALRAPDKLHDFIAAHPDRAPFAIYQPAGNELPLSALVQGVYADVESARAAVQSFPPGLQKLDQLWIRKFGMVQGMLE